MESKRNETFGRDLFGTNAIQETWSGRQEAAEAGTRQEGFYINTIASPMSCEQFTIDLQVHSYQLDGFFSLFDSQYRVLLPLLGDLFDVTLFCGVFVEIR